MITVGVDPDLHQTAYAVLVDGTPAQVGLATVKEADKGRKAVCLMARELYICPWPADEVHRIAIEVPQQYGGGRNKTDPSDLINLAVVAGQAAGVLRTYYPHARMAMPNPAQWKGQVEKTIHHKRICSALGWNYTTDSKGRIFPSWPGDLAGATSIPARSTNHVLDAIGLALWVAERDASRHLTAPTST